MNNWTSRRDELHQLIIVEKKSYAEVSAIYGVSRNAIAGACNRLSLKLNPEEALAIRQQRAKDIFVNGIDKRRERYDRHNERRRISRALLSPRPVFVREPEPEGSLRRTLGSANRSHCRFIAEGTDGFETVICGAQVESLSSWCPDHARICAMPPRRR